MDVMEKILESERVDKIVAGELPFLAALISHPNLEEEEEDDTNILTLTLTDNNDLLI